MASVARSCCSKKPFQLEQRIQYNDTDIIHSFNCRRRFSGERHTAWSATSEPSAQTSDEAATPSSTSAAGMSGPGIGSGSARISASRTPNTFAGVTGVMVQPPGWTTCERMTLGIMANVRHTCTYCRQHRHIHGIVTILSRHALEAAQN